MKTHILLALFLGFGVAACSTVKSNDGNLVQLEYPPGTAKSDIDANALKSCQAVGKTNAIFQREVSTKPGMEWLLPNKLSTYQCQ